MSLSNLRSATAASVHLTLRCLSSGRDSQRLCPQTPPITCSPCFTQVSRTSSLYVHPPPKGSVLQPRLMWPLTFQVENMFSHVLLLHLFWRYMDTDTDSLSFFSPNNRWVRWIRSLPEWNCNNHHCPAQTCPGQRSTHKVPLFQHAYVDKQYTVHTQTQAYVTPACIQFIVHVSVLRHIINMYMIPVMDWNSLIKNCCVPLHQILEENVVLCTPLHLFDNIAGCMNQSQSSAFLD